MTEKILSRMILESCASLYQDHFTLIEERSNERSLLSYIVTLLRERLLDFEVDSEYNREGVVGSRVPKTDSDGGRIIPDIIIHKRGPNGRNLAAIEVKGYWNNEPRSVDEDLLRRLQSKHNYEFIYRLELGRKQPDLILVTHTSEDPV